MTVGSTVTTESRTITETDLVNFTCLAGFTEPLFLDERHGREAGYEGRLVPGALVYAFAEGLMIQTRELHGTGIAFLGMHLTVQRPTFVGDTIHAVCEYTESRASSKPGRGVVASRISVRNQRDEEVLRFEPVRLVRGPDSEAP